MSNFRNPVQLIGNVGEDPKITILDGDCKVDRFPMATNEHYTNVLFYTDLCTGFLSM